MKYTTVPHHAASSGSSVLLREDFARLCAFDSAPATTVPGMITTPERDVLRQIGRQYSDAGSVIDGGCFLGASTLALAEGLLDSKAFAEDIPEPRIHSYDIGTLPKPKNPKAPTTKLYDGFEYTFGESFVPEFEKNTARHAALIKMHEGDIREKHWSALPIEICFLDICKSITIDTHVAQMFFCHFIADTTLLVQQDYFFHRLPWIKITLGVLSDHFEWLGRVESSSIYRCTSVPAANDIPDHLFRDYELETLIKLHRFPHGELLDRRTRLQLDVSEMYLIALKNEEQRALKGLAEIADSYADEITAWDAESGDSSDATGEASRFIALAERLIRIGHVHKVSW